MIWAFLLVGLLVLIFFVLWLPVWIAKFRVILLLNRFVEVQNRCTQLVVSLNEEDLKQEQIYYIVKTSKGFLTICSNLIAFLLSVNNWGFWQGWVNVLDALKLCHLLHEHLDEIEEKVEQGDFSEIYHAVVDMTLDLDVPKDLIPDVIYK